MQPNNSKSRGGRYAPHASLPHARLVQVSALRLGLAASKERGSALPALQVRGGKGRRFRNPPLAVRGPERSPCRGLR